MGDFLLTYDESGKAYFRRLIYLNILLYIVAAFILVAYLVDIIYLILVAIIATGASIIYLAYYLLMNPPIESEEEIPSEKASKQG